MPETLARTGSPCTGLMPGRCSLDVLAPLLPPGTLDYVTRLLDRDDLLLRLARPRRSILGDHRPPGRGVGVHRISLNANLNPYALLTTLVHEVAHVDAWDRRGRRPARPHGNEWQTAYAERLEPLVTTAVLPHDVREALARSRARPRAATCSDRDLLLALSRHDRDAGSRVFVETIAVGTLFRVDDGTVFRAGPMLRTRRRCFEWPYGQEYRVHGLARVTPVVGDERAGPVSGSWPRRAARPSGARPRPPARPRRRRP